MSPDTGTHIIIADTDKPDGLGSILWQTVCRNTVRQVVTCDKLEGNRQVFVDQLIHPKLYLLLLLTRRLMVKIKTHLAFLPLNMRIIRPFTTKQPDHRLIQQMLRGVRRRELFLVVVIKNGGHIIML